MSPNQIPADVPRTGNIQALGLNGFHRVNYTEWGEPTNPRVVVCVHGLTRNGRDFDFLARALSSRYRVFCPDVVGRGASEWLVNKAEYGYPLYLSDLTALIARTGAAQVDWVGTSMGGIIGMMLAAQGSTPIRRLVLNDVGSVVAAQGLQRLAGYVGQAHSFPDLNAVRDYFRHTHHGFGQLTLEQWEHLARHGAHPDAQGFYRLRYDPALTGAAFGMMPLQDVDLSLVWSAVRCSTLVLRGANSDILLPHTLNMMQLQHPNLQIREVPNCGHAPALMDPQQIEWIEEFLS